MPAIITARNGSFCKECYIEGIKRLLGGFTIIKPGGKAAVAVPPLPPGLARDVREAARVIIETRPSHGRHSAHGGVTGPAPETAGRPWS
jgi:hypothetical protein